MLRGKVRYKKGKKAKIGKREGRSKRWEEE